MVERPPRWDEWVHVKYMVHAYLNRNLLHLLILIDLSSILNTYNAFFFQEGNAFQTRSRMPKL